MSPVKVRPFLLYVVGRLADQEVTAGHLIKEEHPTHKKNHYIIVRSELHRFKVTPITLNLLGSDR